LKPFPRGRPSFALAGAAVFCAAATVLAVWPQSIHSSSRLTDLGDAKFCAWLLNWNFHRLFTDPLGLFHANIFFPARYTVAFSENLLGVSLFGVPLYAAGASALTAYNALFLLGMFLSALAAWALARHVTGDAAASLLASLVFAFVPWRLAQLPHIQFQWGAFLALLLLFLLRYLESGRRRDAVLFSVCFAWNGLCNIHYLLFAGLLVALVLGWELATGGPKRGGRVRGAALACVIAAAALLPILIPYWKASAIYGIRRSMGEVAFYSGRPIDFLTAGAQNKLYARLTQKWGHPEGDFFPGLVPLLLAGHALFRLRGLRTAPEEGNAAAISSRRRAAARALDLALLLTAAVAAVSLARGGLEIGPLKLNDPGRLLVVGTILLLTRGLLSFPRRSRFRDLSDFLRRRRLPREALLLVALLLLGIVVALGAHTPYYRFLVRSFGAVFGAIRVPARGIVLFDLALAVLAAWGLALWSRRSRSRLRRAAAIAAAIVATAVEYRAAPVATWEVPKEPAPVYRWLAGLAMEGAVLELPLAPRFDAEHVFRSASHWKNLVNGVSGYYPPRYEELARLGALQPIPAAFWGKVPDGTGLVILHTESAVRDAVVPFARLVGEAHRDGRLEILTDFLHGDGRDFVFAVSGSPLARSAASPDSRAAAAVRFSAAMENPGALLLPPFGVLDFPRDGAEVPSGAGAYGWALDDSGIREIRVAVDGRPAGAALLGGPRRDVAAHFPGFPGAETSGFGFRLPDLPAGAHVVELTLEGRDGGRHTLRLRIRICRTCQSPRPAVTRPRASARSGGGGL
jgi:hypothetical protein